MIAIQNTSKSYLILLSISIYLSTTSLLFAKDHIKNQDVNNSYISNSGVNIEPKTFSFNFKNKNLHDVFLVIADKYDSNIIVSDEVSGSITIKIKNRTQDDVLLALKKIKKLSITNTKNIIVVTTPNAYLATLDNQRYASQLNLTLSKLKKSKKYLGEKISINFKDMETRACLMSIADFVKINFIISDFVNSKTTMRLKNVPWDEALDIMLLVNGLSYRKIGSSIFIAPTEVIAAYERVELEALEIKADLTKKLSERGIEPKEAKLYTGDKLSIDYDDISVRVLLEKIKEFSGKNITISDTVVGNIGIRMKNVPWDEALDMIMRSKGLSYKKIGASIYIAPTEEIAAYEKIESERFERRTKIPVTIVGYHALFWMALIFIYPHSKLVQATFFWNPWVRKFIGFGYIGFLLTWIPFLRTRLFIPFHYTLRSYINSKYYNNEPYYPSSNVAYGGKILGTITENITQIKGIIILTGASGLGKTEFLKFLVSKNKRLTVFLSARDCLSGVIGGIQKRVHGVVKDERYLRTLIYSGAMDICIDGLNEVSPDVRAKITDFVESYSHGNIIIGTQPTDWTPPITAKLYNLQPLNEDQIREFLISREPVVCQKSNCRVDYLNAISKYLMKMLSSDELEKSRQSAINVLSNPMDLSIVAQMIAAGKKPDVYNLQEQQHHDMSDKYRSQNNGRSFPLTKFSEYVYKLRLDNKNHIVGCDFLNELNCMVSEKIMILRKIKNDTGEETQWFFRHEKIMDYYIVQTFLGNNNTRAVEHFNDSRFSGVYYLLASFLPIDDAKALREQIINYAADTSDHIISDAFIKVVRMRSE